MRGFVVGMLAGCAALMGGTAQAVAVADCDWAANAQNIVEPWEKNSRTFYDAQVRVANLDTGGEPACCSAQLLVIFPDHSDMNTQGTCKLVRATKEMGFFHIDFDKLRATYDARKGLLIAFPYSTSIDDKPTRGTAKVRLNLEAGTLVAE